MSQYEKLRTKDAFLSQFKKEKIFESNFDEMDSSEDGVRDLMNEYLAATTADYINWGLKKVRQVPFMF